ncbi:hypothetical protein F441_20542 [Phytophthora nicotianae CJ01A1]|uniref:HTH myb-type domain-containing protein n=4 Tax=Phytophthora nicotianae TaxID=4792 RepID=V9E2N6_PHYNI|nr:hypothetical protein F443_20672 [Phytophthora nicotianae P1569]ETK72908.1 hypothetical protein L915_20089 [Phytophthora nicotianae]ETO61272.1 hypothetical protein F444_20691 [Phytophthora nicotianae P1976]ETP02379.1 hypothetical protein F441_20542 [Phytophthora nicotianae CJ01A1]KUF84490.1 Myb protein J [Phytophthora nicotianae]
MTITHSVQQEFLDDETKDLICIPFIPNSSSPASIAVHSRPLTQQVVPTPALLTQMPARTAESTKGERWTEDEHERFLLGMELFKAGPWKKIANVVGTRDARQTMSHAQKYRQKIKRRKLGLPTTEPRRRVDDSRATSTTKRLRTMSPVEATATATGAENRVVGSSRSYDVSPRVQLPREAMNDTPRLMNGLERATGLVSTETISMASNAYSLMAEVDTGRVGRPSQQLDATLEPLDIGSEVSVARDSWVGPEELWDFLDGRPIAQPDVAGAHVQEAGNQLSV